METWTTTRWELEHRSVQGGIKPLRCRQSMVPDTGLLLELNPTQRHSSIMGVNLWVAKTTNKLAGTTQKSAPLSMKSIKIPFGNLKALQFCLYPLEDLDHHQVAT